MSRMTPSGIRMIGPYTYRKRHISARPARLPVNSTAWASKKKRKMSRQFQSLADPSWKMFIATPARPAIRLVRPPT